jgi:5-methyltetrahydropteroyltriglutamate--homocysteine methyltransferase
MPPRVRAAELWRVAPEFLEQAQDDATLLAIRQQERAGLDIITDGEMRRESYSNRFATALSGIDLDQPGKVIGRDGNANYVPRVVGRIQRNGPVEVRDLKFLRANTDRPVKITVPGPFTMSQQARNDFYSTEEEMVFDYAAAVNRALEGVQGTTALHICFGYAALVPGRPAAYSFLAELADSPVQQISIETAQSSLDCSVLAKLSGKTIILGVIDLSNHQPETAEIVAARVRRALPYVRAEQLVVAPDCGMKYLPADVAFEKMNAMVAGAKVIRQELQSRASAN